MAYCFRIQHSLYMEKKVKSIIYWLMKSLARITLRFYYRGIDFKGKDQIPSEGPLIYAVNHQNAFMDAIIVGGFSPLPTYFMTRSDVFVPPFDWFLDALKMMPIYRIRDGYKSLSKNDAIFDTCKKLLLDKKAILIFPEGNHGLEYYLRPLTKGISRIALQSQSDIDVPIKIIPTGLNYFNHFHSGHKLIVKFGEPIDVTDFLDTYKEHSHKGLKKITDAISTEMKKTLVIANDSDGYPRQKKIFQRKNESENFSTLCRDLDRKDKTNEEKKYPFLSAIGEIFSLPNLPPIALTWWVLKNKVSQKIFYSSIKIAIVMLVFPVWFMLIFGFVWFFEGLKWAAIIFLIQLVTLVIRREIVRFAH